MVLLGWTGWTSGYAYPDGIDKTHIVPFGKEAPEDQPGLQPNRADKEHNHPTTRIVDRLSHLWNDDHEKTSNVVKAMTKDLIGIRDEERSVPGYFPLENMSVRDQRVVSWNFIAGVDSCSDYYAYCTSQGSVGLVLMAANAEWDIHDSACTSIAVKGSPGSMSIISSSLDGKVSLTDLPTGKFWSVYRGDKSVNSVALYGDASCITAVGNQVVTVDLRSKERPVFMSLERPITGLSWHGLNPFTVATCSLNGSNIYDLRRATKPVHSIPGSFFSCHLSPFLAQVL